MSEFNDFFFLTEFLCQFCPHAFYTETRHINHVNSHHKAGNLALPNQIEPKLTLPNLTKMNLALPDLPLPDRTQPNLT
jgi:hypothetical protein